MTKLHALLAVERTVVGQANQLATDTAEKFKRADSYFQGHVKTLQMLENNAANTAAEQAARVEKALVTNVYETMAYFLDFWAKTEDVLFQKNLTNTKALAVLEFRGQVLCNNVPVDELMGLESRLDKLRGMLTLAPTLDASMNWAKAESLGENVWVSAQEEISTKTEKIMVPVVLAPATDKHPAQVKEANKDIVVGSFHVRRFSGSLTAVQKANVLALMDELLSEVKKARTRANDVEVVTDTIGTKITGLILSALK